MGTHWEQWSKLGAATMRAMCKLGFEIFEENMQKDNWRKWAQKRMAPGRFRALRNNLGLGDQALGINGFQGTESNGAPE